ncbi:alpha/beta fold hydrolase [Streptomyces sp. NPDC002589]|uniref:thioesterase II family protein n=1 Tax=Streptomyces sp. NPDC002589 TaxID=3154420 RepID=UPI00331D64F8
MEDPSGRESGEFVRILRSAPEARLRLVCCPHAGASASAYAALARELPEDIEVLAVEYPKRRAQSDRGGFTTIEELADLVSAALAPWSGRPLAVYGHSMGSVVAFEVTRRLEAGGSNVARLFVSGRRSPSDGLGDGLPANDEEIIAELTTLGGLPPKLLEKPKFLRPILTVIRHDYRSNSSYLAPPDAVVRTPVTFQLADSDYYVDPAAAEGWRRHTIGDFRVVHVHGGHFFLNERLPQVVEVITADLREAPTTTAERQASA